MNEGLIPRRYAKALYKVAVERNDADRLYQTMNMLLDALHSQNAIAETMANPFLSDKDKKALLDTAAGDNASDPTFVDFLSLLVKNKRLADVFAIAREYTALYRRNRNIYKVVVTSAAPLDPAEESRLKKLIASHLGGGTMEYVARVNPDLIGGFTVDIDNERLDASVSNELKQLRLNLLK